MSVSLGCYGFMEPNAEYKAKYDAFIACEKAGIKIPIELLEFFNDMRPDSTGKVVPLKTIEVETEMGIAKELILSELPQGVTRIRLYLN